MEKITVRVGDNSDANYQDAVKIYLDEVSYDNLKNFGENYDRAWAKLCDLVQNNIEDLPDDWYIDKIIW